MRKWKRKRGKKKKGGGVSAGLAFVQLAVIQDSGLYSRLSSSHAARKNAPVLRVPTRASEGLQAECKTKDLVAGDRTE